MPLLSQLCTLSGWWKAASNKVDKQLRHDFSGVVINFWWNIWKERNRRTFQNTTADALQVAKGAIDQIEEYQRAMMMC